MVLLQVSVSRRLFFTADDRSRALLGNLQFLEWDDLGKYLKGLVEHKDHLISDGTYLPTFHHQHLAKKKGDGKKDSTYKQHVLCYLLSHAAACPVAHVQVALLQALADVSSPLKVQMLLEPIKKVTQKSAEQQKEEIGDLAEHHAVLLLACFDTSACAILNDPASSTWSLYLAAVQRCYQDGECQITTARFY